MAGATAIVRLAGGIADMTNARLSFRASRRARRWLITAVAASAIWLLISLAIAYALDASPRAAHGRAGPESC